MDTDLEDIYMSNTFSFYREHVIPEFKLKKINKLINLFNRVRIDLFLLIEQLFNISIHNIDYNYLFFIRKMTIKYYIMPLFSESFFKKGKKYILHKMRIVFDEIIRNLDECILLMKERRDLINLKNY